MSKIKEIASLGLAVSVGSLLGLLLVGFCFFVSKTGPFEPLDPLKYTYLLKNDSGAQCTAFLTTDGLVFTAAHCIGDNMIIVDRFGVEHPARPLIIDIEGDMAALDVDDMPKGGLEWDYEDPRPGNNTSARVIGFLGAVSPVPVIQPVIVAFCAKIPRSNKGWAYGIFTIGSPVWPGTSGGPLLNEKNKVIGIAIASHTYHFGSKDMTRDMGQFGSIVEFE